MSQSRVTFLSKFGLLALCFTLCQIVTTSPVNGGPGNLLLHNMVQGTRPSCAERDNFPAWYQPSEKFDFGDCTTAIDMFYNQYVSKHKGARYEFYTDRYSPIHSVLPQRVPLKFAHGISHSIHVLASPLGTEVDW